MMRRFVLGAVMFSAATLLLSVAPAVAGKPQVDVTSSYGAGCTITATATTNAHGPLWVNFAAMGTGPSGSVLASTAVPVPKGDDHVTATLTLTTGEHANLVYAYLYRGDIDSQHSREAMDYVSQSVSYPCGL